MTRCMSKAVLAMMLIGMSAAVTQAQAPDQVSSIAYGVAIFLRAPYAANDWNWCWRPLERWRWLIPHGKSFFGF